MLRRVILVVLAVPLIAIIYALVFILGVIKATEDLANGFQSAWKGRE